MGLKPDSFEPQASVLGAILMQPQLMSEASTMLTADDFTAANCRTLWMSMVKLSREGKPADPVLCMHELAGFEGAGDLIAMAMELAPVAGGFHAHVEALIEQSKLIRLRDIADELAHADDAADAQELIAKLNRIAIQHKARERRSMTEMMKSFADRHADTVTPDYIEWPFKSLTEGVKMRGGKYIIIGGYPSDGKTAFALACGFKQANKKNVRFYSFETDADTIEDRAVAAIAGIEMENIQNNSISESEWMKFAEASSAASWKFECVSAAGMTVDDIRSDALASNADIIYIDYLQLINPGRSSRDWTRFDAVTRISMELQQLAKTTGITVVALSQMSRPQADKKGNVPEPTMHNLRESGQLEQDADAILLLYRTDQNDIRSQRKLSIAKNKEGRTGRFLLDFDGRFQRFRETTAYKPQPTKPTPVLADREYPQLPMDTEVPF